MWAQCTGFLQARWLLADECPMVDNQMFQSKTQKLEISHRCFCAHPISWWIRGCPELVKFKEFRNWMPVTRMEATVHSSARVWTWQNRRVFSAIVIWRIVVLMMKRAILVALLVSQSTDAPWLRSTAWRHSSPLPKAITKEHLPTRCSPLKFLKQTSQLWTVHIPLWMMWVSMLATRVSM